MFTVTAVLYFVRFSNDSAIIDQIIKALNDDDLAGIQKWQRIHLDSSTDKGISRCHRNSKI